MGFSWISYHYRFLISFFGGGQKILWDLFYSLAHGLFWCMLHVYVSSIQKLCSVVFGGSGLQMSIGLRWLIALLRFSIALQYFCLLFYQLLRGGGKSPTVIVCFFFQFIYTEGSSLDNPYLWLLCLLNKLILLSWNVLLHF